MNLEEPDYIFGIPTSIITEPDIIIITDYIVDRYGVGNNIKEAVEDYKKAVKEYYEQLLKDKDKLGIIPQKHFNYLCGKIIQ